MIANTFLHGELYKDLETNNVLSKIGKEVTHFAYQEQLEGIHYMYKYNSSGKVIVEDWVSRTPQSIGYILSIEDSIGPRVEKTCRLYKKPEEVELTRPSSNLSVKVSVVGETNSLYDNWVYLLSRQKNEYKILAILKDTRIPLKKGKKAYVFNQDKDDYELITIKDTTRHTGYSLGSNEGILNIVEQYMYDRFFSRILPNVGFDIDIYDSITTKLKNTDVLVHKERFLNSPFMQKSVSFKIKLTKNKWRKITLWKEDNRINIYIEEGRKSTEDYHYYFFDEGELPNELNQKTLNSFFKKINFNNKDRRKRETEYVENVLNIKRDDIPWRKSAMLNGHLDSPFNKNADHTASVKQAFLDYTIDSRNYSYMEEDTKKERLGQKEILAEVLKLVCAYWDENLRGELVRKTPKVKNKKNRFKRNKVIIAKNKWEWGTDRVRYINVHKSGNKMNTIFYTRPFMATRYVKNIDKYPNAILLEEPINGRTHSVVKTIEGYWKPVGESNKFPTYFAGRPSNGGASKVSIPWLEYMSSTHKVHIQHGGNGGELRIPNTPYRVDGYCEKTNTIYEFHGDYWHGNPNIYSPDEINKTNGKTMGELYENTIQREKILRDMGYTLVVIWESEWRNKK